MTDTQRTRLRSLFTLAGAAGVLAGVIVGVLLVREGRPEPGAAAPSDSTAFDSPRPGSVDELVGDYDVIVVGVIEGVQRTDTFRVSGPQNPNAPPLPTAPLTFLNLRVERVVSAPPEVREGATITLRIWGPPDSPTSGNLLKPKAGERRLFLLRMQPDGTSYGTKDAVFNIDGGAVTYADQNGTPVRGITDKTAPEAFIQAVKEARERRPVSPPVIPPTATPRP